MNKKKTDEKKEQLRTFIIIGAVVLIVIFFFLLRGCNRKYTVDFDTNGGSAVSSVEIEKNGTIEKPSDPTREGYVFAGWYLNDELFDFTTPITGNITLEARWADGVKEGLTLNTTEETLLVNDTLTLSALLNGEATKEELVWSSSDPKIASVDENGKVKALKVGEVTITVQTKDGRYKASCTITVTNDKNGFVTSVVVSGDKKMMVGESQKLTVTIKPTDATNKNVTWKSSNPKIATVDENGKVKALKPGKVTITATAKDGSKKYGSITITIEEEEEEEPTETNVAVTGVKIQGDNEVKVGSNLKLKAVVSPSKATNKKVTWKSSDPSIATVDQNGTVHGVNDGEVVITVTTEDGNYEDTITVKVSSTYAIVFTAIPEEFGDSLEYTILVTRNGSAWSDYSVIKYNGQTKPFKDATVKATNVDENVKSATIILKNGTEINNVSVSYK